ncbi:MAG: TonB-dependent receptor domain-containing protein, partial [Gammaproteobacteria bacterium]
ESIAGFAELKFQLSDATRLTLGGRLTYEKIDFNSRRNVTVFLGSPPTPAPFTVVVAAPPDLIISPTQVGTTPTWRVILDHRVSDDVLLYASYNRGTKSGAFNSTNIADEELLPEQVDAFEAGFKATTLDSRVRINGSGYYYSYGNYQVLSLLNAQLDFNNAGAEIYGAELELEAAVTENFRINAGVGWIHATFTNFPGGTLAAPMLPGGTVTAPLPFPPGGNTIIEGVSLTGNRLTSAPDFTAILGANYTVPAFGGKLVFDASIYYNDGYFTEADNRNRQPAYERLTASVAWTDASEHVTVRLWGKNLTDSAIANVINATEFLTAVTYQPPRTYGVELGFKF